MKRCNAFKNLLIAGLTGFVYYKYILPGTPILTQLFAIAFVIWIVLIALESWDNRSRAKAKIRREQRQEMKKSA